MAKQTINTLKNWFKTALKPTQSQFWDWLDSFWHKDEKIPLSSIDGIQAEFDKKRSTDTPIEINEVSGLEEALENAGGGGSAIIVNDIPVYGTSFGKYASGETIPAAGKTVEAVLLDVCMKAVNPTAALSITSGVPAYNSEDITNILSFSHTINTPGATVATAVLQFRRNNTGAWITINSVTTTPGTFSHVNTAVTDKVTSFNYQYIVTDSNGSTITATAQVTPAGYAAPTTNIAVSGTREIGNISTLLSGTISQTAQNGVAILSRTLQYSLNNSVWVDITTFVNNTINYTHNDAALVNSTIIYYRLSVICSNATGNQTTNLALGSISFVYKNAFGYNTSTSPTLATLLAMGNNTLTNGKAKTVTATAPAGNYTYYVYCAAAGDLSGVVMDGVAAVLGAFTKLADITGTNSYGANVTYRVYKSNAPAAFTNNQLVIS